MKRAYVKPVFLAEEFVAATSYAATPCSPNASIYEALLVERNDTTFCGQNCGHRVGANGSHIDDTYTPDSSTYWEYAEKGDGEARIFNSNNAECDFLWNYESTGEDSSHSVCVWESSNKSERPGAGILDTGWSLVEFFLGNSTSHVLGYNGEILVS